ncbi:MAG: hypothetical protein ACI9KE_001501 [Polyangiales bacterium]|jgi:hypothetical protein
MRSSRRLLVLGLCVLAACDTAPNEEPASPTPPARPSADRLAAEADSVLVIGGGADPASTQISLAQDVRLARDTFVHLGADPTVLFGSGDGSLVQRSTDVARTSLREELADFFDPRDRAVRYESFDVRAMGPADSDMVLSLVSSLPLRPEPRFFFLAGHGERGDEPWDAIIRLWGDVPLSVPEFAEALGEAPARVVITSCFGGGFASLFFRDGYPPEGTIGSSDVMPNRCGFFASTWDREASGCDPNPERAQQQGYAMHFLHALEGQGREGNELDVDFDDDGEVTMLEAHTQARIADRSFDVPSTTSELFLRMVASKPVEGVRETSDDEDALEETLEDDGEAAAAPEAEEAAVIAALGAELGLPTAVAATSRVEALRDAIAEQEGTHGAIQERADYAYYSLRIRLLERWPILDDPWHGEHGGILARESSAIEGVLHDSLEARDYEESLQDQERVALEYDELQVQLARALVLSRAYENIALTASLRAQGGELWQTYQALRQCERILPSAFVSPAAP